MTYNRHYLQEGDVRWEGYKPYVFPSFCIAAGWAAGFFGVGGGLVAGIYTVISSSLCSSPFSPRSYFASIRHARSSCHQHSRFHDCKLFVFVIQISPLPPQTSNQIMYLPSTLRNVALYGIFYHDTIFPAWVDSLGVGSLVWLYGFHGCSSGPNCPL